MEKETASHDRKIRISQPDVSDGQNFQGTIDGQNFQETITGLSSNILHFFFCFSCLGFELLCMYFYVFTYSGFENRIVQVPLLLQKKAC